MVKQLTGIEQGLVPELKKTVGGAQEGQKSFGDFMAESN